MKKLNLSTAFNKIAGGAAVLASIVTLPALAVAAMKAIQTAGNNSPESNIASASIAIAGIVGMVVMLFTVGFPVQEKLAKRAAAPSA